MDKELIRTAQTAQTRLAATQTPSPQQERAQEKLRRADPFADFELYHPELRRVLAEAERFCVDILSHQPPRWLSLLGPSGVGKTFILRKLVRYMVKCNMGDRDHEMQIARINPLKDLDTYTAAREWGDFDLLYIEDIAAGTGDKGSGAVIRQRLAELLQLRTGKWTLLCANLLLPKLEEVFDGRVASRLIRDGSVCIEISDKVPDYAMLSRQSD